MKIDQAISSCKAIFEYAFGSQLLQVFFVSIFIIFPVARTIATLIKTTKKLNAIKANSSARFPLVLKKIISKHNLPKSLFLMSEDKNFLAFSAGLLTRKIVLSRPTTQKLTMNELEAVVLHEIHHTRFFHALFIFIAETLTYIFFFIPSLKDLQLQLKLEFEKAADKYAVTTQQTTKYVKSSLKKALVFDHDLILFPQFSYRVIDQRIDSLNAKKTQIIFSHSRFVVSIIVMTIFASLFLLNKRYAMAAVVEEKITCSLYNCVRDCVVYEFRNQPLMSEVNYSFDR